MDDHLSQYRRRALQYLHIDGLGDLILGFFFLSVGLFCLGIAAQPVGSTLSFLLRLGLVVLILSGAFAVRPILTALKERLTYPRTGYVTYRHTSSRGKNILAASLAIGLMILVNLFLMFQHPAQDLSALVDGLLMSPLLLVAGQRLRRFTLLAGFAFLTGLAIFRAGLEGYQAHGAFFGLNGLAILISGVIAWLSYLHSTQPSKHDPAP